MIAPSLSGKKNRFDVMKFITEIFLYKRGKYFYMEYLLLNGDESESKRMEYKSIKYSTLKHKLDEVLMEYELC